MALKVLKQSSDTEKHSAGVTSICFCENRVLSSAEDGKIKIWTPDLKVEKEVETTCGGILSLACCGDIAYTCAADQTIQAWDSNNLQNKYTLQTSLYIPLKLIVENGILWAGDSQGNVAKFEGSEESGKYELVEEVWDFIVTTNPPLIITARDRDITISNIIQGPLKKRAVLSATLEGRSPINITSDRFCCLDRDGRNICVHDNNTDTKFKKQREIKASELIINAMCAGEVDELYVGGYDNQVSLWNIADGSPLGSIDLGSCINTLTKSSSGAYVGLTDGRIVLVGR